MSASNKAGILLLRPIGHTRTEHQLRPGEGFAPDYRPVADRITLPEHAKPTPRLAVPPAWTAQGNCVPRSGVPKAYQQKIIDQYDEHSGGRGSGPGSGKHQAERAATLCKGCPVLAECREAAMLEEEGLNSHNQRHGIRGGLTPEGRRLLAIKLRAERAEDGAVA